MKIIFQRPYELPYKYTWVCGDGCCSEPAFDTFSMRQRSVLHLSDRSISGEHQVFTPDGQEYLINGCAVWVHEGYIDDIRDTDIAIIEEKGHGMKIVYGDIFSSHADALVCPVNRMGVMGAGLAKQFSEKIDHLNYYYEQSCKSGSIRADQLYMYYTTSIPIPNTSPTKYRIGYILCFPTKHHWRDQADLVLIETGLRQAVNMMPSYITTVAWPALGCGLGKLDWESQVRPLMESILGKAPFESIVYLHRE